MSDWQIDAESFPTGNIRWMDFPRLGWKLKIVTADGWYQINVYRSAANPNMHLNFIAIVLRKKENGWWGLRLHRFYDDPSAFQRQFGQPFVEGGYTPHKLDYEAIEENYKKEREVANVRKRVIAYGIKHGYLPPDYQDHRTWT